MIIQPKGRDWSAIVTEKTAPSIKALMAIEEGPSSAESSNRRWSILRKKIAHGPTVRVGKF